MAESMHLLIPMSGQGKRFQKAEYEEPKPLIPINGEPMIERALSSFPVEWPSHFVMADNHRDTDLPRILRENRGNSYLSYVPIHARGPSFAVLEGLKNIPDEAPVLVSYCDYGMVWDAARFERFVRDADCDACVLAYRGFHAHYLSDVMYAYCRMDGNRVVEIREKGCFTDNRENEFASCGAYYFKSARLLRQAIEHQVKQDLTLNGELYTSLTVEALLQRDPNAHVRVFEIFGFFQWGTPEDLQTFEYWERTFQAFNRNVGTGRGAVDQVLMPMAGAGSRFSTLFKQPKPLIPVAGAPMFMRALQSLPQAQKTAIVALEAHEEAVTAACGSIAHEIVALAQTPSGQALSCQAGLKALDHSRSLVVSSCDHGIVTNRYQWEAFASNPRCDAAIFTITSFPGVARIPKSYAYVVPESNEEDFPCVIQVSVKQPVSDIPQRDNLLVGTFWFKTAEVMAKGIESLVKNDIRVNGELYLDSIFMLLIEQGLSVRMFPLEGYICWGDPDALDEALYWQDLLGDSRLYQRQRCGGYRA